MHIHDEAPPLNPWPFLAGDAVLLATAFLIAWQADAPLNGAPLIAVAACVCLGAILAIIPFVLNHTRRQDLALADRQREIAALAQTTASSAEQISIAASNLHSIVDHAARALKLGEALPHKLQEKINDFKTQLNEVAVTENEALAQEINTLRTSETEHLETALAGIRKTAAELASLEAASQKHLKELNDSLARFATDAAKAADSAARSIEASRAAAEKSLSTAHSAALAALQEAASSAMARLDRTISRLADKSTEHLASSKIDVAPAAPTPPRPSEKSPSTAKPPTGETPAPASTPPFVPQKTANPFAKPATTPPHEPPTTTSAPSSEISNFKSSTSPDRPATRPPVVSSSTTPVAEDVPTALLTEEKPVARKRPARKSVADDHEFTLGIELPPPANEFSQVAPDDATPAVSADGLTRLIVTAYIGIGNKLFVRGEGPGLTWDRGVPLQFVSIGKWRWESADATAPVRVKLYKNDTQECASLGTLTMTPGHQHEVTASFS